MMKKIFVGLMNLVCAAALISSAEAETNPQFYAVQASATVQSSPAQITLKWPADANATGYTVSRKNTAVAPWSTVGTLGGSATVFVDGNVVAGSTYEYQITKNTSVGYVGTGYVYAGIHAPLVDSRGKLVLVVDKTYASQLASELNRLEADLVGDGWVVIRRDVNRTDSVVAVKNVIKAEYNLDPTNVKAVFLFGHVPVPYSGNFNPDGHPDHQGAWAADAYYGDMDGVWTDSTVNNSSAHKPANRNVPGDGKFDQSDLPSDVELAVGRVDLYNMTCFSNKTPSRSELDLLRQYLNKDHNFRHGRLPLPRRGLVCDNFGERSGEAFAASGWRNFAPMFGAENTTAVGAFNFFPTLKSNGYLWAYGTGGGSYYSCHGIGTSDDFAVNDIQAVFTMFLGSYFGDWDNESNFLRAPLGSSTYTLTTSWAGRPHWFYHHMALGETIGHSTKLSQNNKHNGTYAKQNYGTRQVHVALLGDPTLRMHPVLPPFNVTAAAVSGGMSVAWAASSDTGIVGYHVYRGSSPKGPFTRVTTSPVNGTAFTDAAGSTSQTYMVRAIKLEQSGSGSYYNASQGAYATAASTPNPAPEEIAPNAPSDLKATSISASRVDLSWTDNSAIEIGFKILRKNGEGAWERLGDVKANVTSFTDSTVPAGASLSYVIYVYSTSRITLSPILEVNTPALPVESSFNGSATFIKKDTVTSGDWKGVYGKEGFQIAAEGKQLPGYGGTAIVGASLWAWTYSTLAPSALQKSMASDRIASCWYSATSFDVQFNFTDTNTHQVSLYLLDWDNAGRKQTIEIIDTASGTKLDLQSWEGFGSGVYLTWELKGRVTMRFTRTGGPNAVLSGIFFGRQAPTANSLEGKARFIGSNSTVKGSWKGAFGNEGSQVIGNAANLPAFATVTASGSSEWTWNGSTSDVAALQKLNSTDRIAACRYSGGTFDLNVKLTDGKSHKVSLYFLDWDMLGRSEKVELIDTASGTVLHSTTVSAFQNGTYLSWDVAGAVTFRVTRTAGPNCVVSGVFIDAASAPL